MCTGSQQFIKTDLQFICHSIINEIPYHKCSPETYWYVVQLIKIQQIYQKTRKSLEESRLLNLRYFIIYIKAKKFLYRRSSLSAMPNITVLRMAKHIYVIPPKLLFNS